MKKTILLKSMLLLCALIVGSSSLWAVSAGDTFARISAIGDLADGDEIIFVNQAETYACGTTQNSNNRSAVAITVSDHSYTYASKDNVQVFVVKINASGKYGFHTGSGYIYSASSGSNYLRTNAEEASTDPSGTYAWTLAISDYVVSATNVTNTSYYLAFNGTLFSQYKSGQSKPLIFKKQAGVTTLSVKTAPTKTRYEVGENLDMTGFSLDADGNTVTSGYTMTMDDAAIANGATLSSVGKKTITVSYGGKTVNQNISVGAVQSIAVTTAPTKTNYDTGDSFDPTGMVVTASLSTEEVSDPDTWMKPVTGYTVDPEDNLAPANTSVTITYATKSTTQAITVTNVAVTGVSLKTSTTIAKGATETLTPTFTPSNATNKNVSWESDDTSVATVSAAGVVTAKAVGTANIKVTTEDGDYESTCAVTVTDPKGSITNPYTVSDIEGQATATTFGDNIYVTGYIVGCVKDNKCYKTTADKLVDTNLLLADTPDASFSEGASVNSTTDGLIPVELPSGTIRTNWGVASNNVIGYKVILKGNAKEYFSTYAIKGTSEIVAVSVPVTLGTNGYATFANSNALDLTALPDGLTAYKAAVAGSNVNFTELDQKVPANTGMLLKGSASGEYNIPVAATSTSVVGNAFLVNTSGTTFDAESGYSYFGLKKNTLTFGLFNPASVAIPASKAYLKVLTSALSSHELTVTFDGEQGDVTGIKTLTTDVYDNKSAVYNLNGQRVNENHKGIVIVNGKKYLNK